MSDYPTCADLRKIRNWKSKDMKALLDFVKSIWWMPDWGWHETQRTLYLSTGGYSGNESIICELQMSKSLFWFFCWQQSKRGGHYQFDLTRMRKLSK